jgi:NADPH:quinone reductase-like Zn-dependent oxidoreductase
VCAAPATSTWSGRSGPTTSLTTRGPTSPEPRSATTSSSTTWKPSPLAAVRRALTPTGTLIPNSGRGGRWLGPLGRIVKARVLSGFTRQQLKPFLSVGKRQDLLTLADLLATGQVTPVIDRTYPLDEAADALRYVGAGHTRGKVVVTV